MTESDAKQEAAAFDAYRIVRYKHGLTIQGRNAPGIVTGGRYKGQPKEIKWHNLEHHTTLVRAAQRLVQRDIAHQWQDSQWTGQDLSEAIEGAMSRIETIVRNVEKEVTETSSAK